MKKPPMFWRVRAIDLLSDSALFNSANIHCHWPNAEMEEFALLARLVHPVQKRDSQERNNQYDHRHLHGLTSLLTH